MPARGVDELFNDALECRPEDRETFLKQACADEPELYHRLSSLLKLHDQAGSFLQRPPVDSPSVTAKLPDDGFAPGQLLGERYRIESLLGRGGMGEVWRAYDLKLRVDVALKRLHKQIFATDQGLELLRQEVRSARNVLSPHVCRIFDLVDQDGQELVSMEYIDGRTLQSLLQEKAPLELREAGEIAAQLLAGLEAIHEADLVHRDVKPANVMLTRTGRVVLMDFGLAKGLADIKEGSIAGTPAYMAPEQARGAAIDARADIFAAGVILAEMLIRSDKASREQLWSGVRENPAKLPESPWEDVLRKAVAWEPDGRYETARDMARSLEEVTIQAEGVDDRSPYPGLHFFTEADAEFFFGREVEVEAVWKKLQRQQMLAVAGLSGAGKTSFLRAGLIPAAPEGWRCLVTTPGSSPLKALAQALVPEITDDAEAMGQILDFEEPGVAAAIVARWRARHGETLLILDQFEELFTLNPPEVQARFASLLRELAFESDVHVLLSMRDDFLFGCQEHEALQPTLADLTLMGTLTGSALRRALVQPALACGYRFEDDALVDEMIEEVREERGALPLLAFAAAQMWQQHDRTSGTLTREAYERIGGVGGALAQHAEATLDRIGSERTDIVRELFRNLITSQGTRVARTTDDLLSVFEDRQAAQAVLGQLVDARLLTSFELPGNGDHSEPAGRHRIELVHESLLRSWPRLVRWQTQDADGAQLRDQLRQAAHLWEDRSRSDDLLWTGTAYQEFQLWRERYPGGLSESEASFAEAMEARSLRQHRRRTLAWTGTFLALLAVLAVVGTLWQRSDRVARLSEAQRFQMLAEENLERDNTLALAMATASLEREDDLQTRRLALLALGKGPVRFTLEVPDTLYSLSSAVLSPDGEWLATVNEDDVLLWPPDGGPPRSLECEETEAPYVTHILDFHPDGSHLAAVRALKGHMTQEDLGPHLVSLWTVPEGRHLGSWRAPAPGYFDAFVRGNPPQLLAAFREDSATTYQWLRYSPGSEEPEYLGMTEPRLEKGMDSFWTVDPSGRLILHTSGDRLYVSHVDELGTAAGSLIGRHESRIDSAVFSETGERIVSGDMNGVINVWLRQSDGTYVLDSKHETGDVARVRGFNRQGSKVLYVSGHQGAGALRVVALDRQQPLAEPTEFLPPMFQPGWPAFTPDEDWLVFSWCDSRFGESNQVWFYPMDEQRPRILRAWPQELELSPDVFVDGGSSLLASAPGGELWLCDLASAETDCRLLWRNPAGQFVTGGRDPLGRHALVNGFEEAKAWVIPIDGTEPLFFEETEGCLGGVARDPYQPRVAVGGGFNRCKIMPDKPIIQIHDLTTGTQQTLEAPGECGFYGIWFLPNDRLLSFGQEGLLIWDLASGTHEVLSERNYFSDSDMSADGRFLVVASSGSWELWDLEERSVQHLPIPVEMLAPVALSSDASLVVVGTWNGEVIVLPHDAKEPFMLSGHDGLPAVWISPDNREIRSASGDGTVRIWPIPQGRPVHNLPHDEFLDYLRAQTNLRVVTDVEAEEGYRVAFDRFPGWEEAPTW